MYDSLKAADDAVSSIFAAQNQISPLLTVCQWLQAAVLVLDRDLRCVQASSAACKLLGESADRLQGRPVRELFPDIDDLSAALDDAREHAAYALPAQRKKHVRHGQQQFALAWMQPPQPLQESQGHLLLRLTPLESRPEQAYARTLGSPAPRNTSAQRHAQGMEDFNRFFGPMLDACFLLDLGGRVLLANHAAGALTGRPLMELQSLHFARSLCVAPEQFEKLLHRLDQGESAPGAAIELRLPDQSPALCHCSLRGQRDSMGRMMAVEAVLQLASGSAAKRLEPFEYRLFLERRVMERTSELSRSNKLLQDKIIELETARGELSEYRTRLRELAFELSLVEQRERRRLALELHDGVCQDLAMARMRLSSLKKELDCQGLCRQCDELLELIKKMIRDSRGLIWEMGSPELYELGFVTAIEELAEEFQTRHNLSASCLLCVPRDLELYQDQKIMLFQMVRELLTNVVKHANASSACIEIWQDEQELMLRVCDDGRGFAPDAVLPPRRKHDSGFGLFSIRERLNLIGGSLQISSDQGGACCLLRMPLHQARQTQPAAHDQQKPPQKTP